MIVNLDPQSLAGCLTDVNNLIFKGLRRQKVGFLIAPPDSGKSYVALSMAYELATGVPFIGIKAQGQKQMKTLCWPAEDGVVDTANRIDQHLKHLPKNLHSQIIENVSLWKSDDPIACSSRAGNEAKRLSKVAREKLIESARAFDLVIIDTLRAAIGSASETEDDFLINQCLLEIAKSADCGVLVVHHPTKQVSRGQEAVSSVSPSGLSITSSESKIHLFISKKSTKGNDIYTLQHTKANHIPISERLNNAFEWLPGSIPHVPPTELDIVYESKPKFQDKRQKKKVPRVIPRDDSMISEETKALSQAEFTGGASKELRERFRNFKSNKTNNN